MPLMTRIPLAHLLVAITVVLAAGIVRAQPAPFDLVSPEKGVKVNDLTVTFIWNYPAGATTFKTTLKNLDGSQSITLTSTDADCFMVRCSVIFDPTLHNWIWHEGDTYSWQVKAKDAGGENVGKSKVWTFKVDMLSRVDLLGPVDDSLAVFQGGLVYFEWFIGDGDYFTFTIRK
jgi:hypothetical protein